MLTRRSVTLIGTLCATVMASTCAQCPVGRYQDVSSQGECLQCPDGAEMQTAIVAVACLLVVYGLYLMSKHGSGVPA